MNELFIERNALGRTQFVLQTLVSKKIKHTLNSYQGVRYFAGIQV
jgi:hypothetical protein